MSGSAPARIVILGLNYAPETVGIGPYTAGLAEWFAAGGHAVSAVAGRPYYPQWQPFAGHSPWWRHRRENAVSIWRCPHYIPRRPTGVTRLLHHASFALAALPPLLALGLRLGPRLGAKRPQVIICITPSLLSAWAGWFVARLSGAKLWLHVQDFEAGAALATGILPQGSLALAVARRLEAIMHRADLVTTISPQMCRRLEEKGIATPRIAELRNWANHLGAITAANGSALRRDWQLEGKFIALYSGNIGHKQGLNIIVEAARRLRDDPRIVIMICGNGAYRPQLERLGSALPNLRFQDLQPPDRFAAMMRMADCHLLPQRAEAADLVLPSKLANILASARPVIATAAKGTGLAQEAEGCGIVIPPGNPAALADAIRWLADSPGQARRFGEAGALKAKQRWAKDTVLQEAERLLWRLLAKADAG